MIICKSTLQELFHQKWSKRLKKEEKKYTRMCIHELKRIYLSSGPFIENIITGKENKINK